MSFLENVLRKISKSDKSASFNFRKHRLNKLSAQPLRKLEDYEDEYDTIDDVDKRLDDEARGIYPRVQQEPIQQQPIQQQQEVNPAQYVEMIMEYIKENFNNYKNGFVSVIPNELISTREVRTLFAEKVREFLPKDVDYFLQLVWGKNYEQFMQEINNFEKQQLDSEVDSGDIDLIKAYENGPNVLSLNEMMDQKTKYLQNKADVSEAKQIAFEKAIGTPGTHVTSGKIKLDPRMNFFIQNPDKLPDNIVLPEGFTKGQLSNYLRENYKEELVRELLRLIQNGDKSVDNWIMKKFFVQEDKNVHLDAGIGDDQSSIGNLMDKEKLEEDRRNQRVDDSGLIEEQKQKFKSAATAFFQYYLKDIGESLKKLIRSSIENSYEENDENMMNLQKFVSKGTTIEKFSLFAYQLIEQIDKLFSEENATFTPVKGSVEFRNSFGRVVIPNDYLEQVFKGNIDKTPEELYSNVMEFKRDGSQDLSIMRWFGNLLSSNRGSKGIVTQRALVDNYQKTYALKQAIIGILSRGYSEENLAKNPSFLKNGELEKYLFFFSNADQEGISDEEKYNRILRYINLTAGQHYQQEKSLDGGRGGNGSKYLERLEIISKIGFDENGRPIDKNGRVLTSSDAAYNQFKTLRAYSQDDVASVIPSVYNLFLENKKLSDDNPKKINPESFEAFFSASNPTDKIMKNKKLSPLLKQMMDRDKYLKSLSKTENLDANEIIDITDIDPLIQEKLSQQDMNKLDTLLRTYSSIRKSFRKRKDLLDKVTDKYNKTINTYNNRILSKLESENNRRSKLGEDALSPEEFVGVPGWDGVDALSVEDYDRINNEGKATLGAANRVLPDLKNKIRKFTFFDPDRDGNSRMDHSSVQFIEKKLQEKEEELREFARENGLTDEQVKLAKILYMRMMKKIASIENMMGMHSQFKFANNNHVFERMIEKIEKDCRAELDLIVN